MAGAYSTRFIYHQGVGYSARYYVPAGKRAVLKSMVAYNGSSAVVNLAIAVNNTVVWFVPVPGGGSAVTAPFMLVVYAGEYVELYQGTAGMASCLSGYLLTDSAAAAEDWQDSQSIEEGLGLAHELAA